MKPFLLLFFFFLNQPHSIPGILGARIIIATDYWVHIILCSVLFTSHSILTVTLWVRNCDYPHLTNTEMEDQEALVTWPKPFYLIDVELTFEHKPGDSKNHAVITTWGIFMADLNLWPQNTAMLPSSGRVSGIPAEFLIANHGAMQWDLKSENPFYELCRLPCWTHCNLHNTVSLFFSVAHQRGA